MRLRIYGAARQMGCDRHKMGLPGPVATMYNAFRSFRFLQRPGSLFILMLLAPGCAAGGEPESREEKIGWVLDQLFSGGGGEKDVAWVTETVLRNVERPASSESTASASADEPWVDDDTAAALAGSFLSEIGEGRLTEQKVNAGLQRVRITMGTYARIADEYQQLFQEEQNKAADPDGPYGSLGRAQTKQAIHQTVVRTLFERGGRANENVLEHF